jgi:SAM-dependent methyltransferase
VDSARRKEREAAYFREIGEEGLLHAATKPWCDPQCGAYLQEIGPVFSLCPPPPARLLDIGCGAGWTSAFFAERGYDVLGIDLSPEAIDYATSRHAKPNLRFAVQDFDHDFDSPQSFDVAVFFDALHHSTDEAAPLRLAFSALRSGGVCIVCEPGRGHAKAATSLEAIGRHGVTERDMTPPMIITAAKRAGFRSFEVYPHPQRFAVAAYRQRTRSGPAKQRILSVPVVAAARAFYAATIERRTWGLVRLTK